MPNHSDEMAILRHAVMVQQAITAAVLIEIGERAALAAEEKRDAVRHLAERLHRSLDLYLVPGGSDDVLERVREAGRKNIDAALAPLLRG